ncbi:WGR domain-containing protein, partial [Gilliamella sp. B2923]|nr:WGR domain-containing protein [Gilliamella sp. B2923]
MNNKFWYIEQKDNLYTVLYGAVGTEGQKHTKTFASQEEAEKEACKIIKSKLKKGYQEKTIPATLLPAIARLSQIIKMPDAPKPKYHPKPTPPKDVIDDGKEKPWFDLDEWADEGQPNPFDFDELRKVPPKKVAPVKQPPKQSNAPIKKETVTKTPQEQEFDNLKV